MLRATVVAAAVIASAPARAQPAPQPQTAPPPARNPALTFSASVGLGAVLFDEASGPCPDCSHSPPALATHGGVGLRILPSVALVAHLQVHLQFVPEFSGGHSAKFEQISGFVGAQLAVAPRAQLVGGLGYATGNYSYEQSGLFGSTSADLHVGRGPALVGAARLHLWTIGARGALDAGLEARLVLTSLDGAASTGFTIDGVVGWF